MPLKAAWVDLPILNKEYESKLLFSFVSVKIFILPYF